MCFQERVFFRTINYLIFFCRRAAVLVRCPILLPPFNLPTGKPPARGKAKMVFLVLHRAADGGLPPDSDVDIDMEAEEECGDTPAAAAPALGADHTVHTANPQQTEGSSSRPIDTTVAIG